MHLFIHSMYFVYIHNVICCIYSYTLDTVHLCTFLYDHPLCVSSYPAGVLEILVKLELSQTHSIYPCKQLRMCV